MENSLFLNLEDNELLENEGGKSIMEFLGFLDAAIDFFKGFNQGVVDGYNAATKK